MRNPLLRSLILLTLALSLALTGCAELPLRLPVSGVIEPRIVPSGRDAGYTRVRREFTFESHTIRLDVPVNDAVYAGSVSAEKSAIIFNKQPTDWVSGYYRAFIEESHQAQFYKSLREALHEVRDSQKLDSDRYVELVLAMVQGMEYKTDPVNLSPKFPIETFGDGYGDCDDKTLLAAAILSQDGYDVAILMFSPEQHVSLGIKAPGLDYKGTGYAFVEATAPSLAGIAPEELAGGVKLTSQPKVIRVGDGKRAYSAGAQIQYIQTRLDQLKKAETDSEGRFRRFDAQLASRREDLTRQKSALDNSQGDAASANAAIDRYNEQVRAYNDLAAHERDLAAYHNSLVAAEQFVADHQTDRPGVYEQLRSLRL